MQKMKKRNLNLDFSYELTAINLICFNFKEKYIILESKWVNWPVFLFKLNALYLICKSDSLALRFVLSTLNYA